MGASTIEKSQDLEAAKPFIDEAVQDLDKTKKSSGWPTSNVLQWAEFGSVFATMGGAIAAIVTGQIAYAVSPLSLSVVMNLWRRRQADQIVHQRCHNGRQETLRHFSDALNAFEQERCDFLLTHAGKLDTQDQPQVLSVLSQIITKVETDAGSLQEYLHHQIAETHNTLDPLKMAYESNWAQIHNAQTEVESRWSSGEYQELSSFIQGLISKTQGFEQKLHPFLNQTSESQAIVETPQVLLEQSRQALQNQVTGLADQWQDCCDTAAGLTADLKTELRQAYEVQAQQLKDLEQDLDAVREIDSDSHQRLQTQDISVLGSRLTQLHDAVDETLRQWQSQSAEFQASMTMIETQLESAQTLIEQILQPLSEQPQHPEALIASTHPLTPPTEISEQLFVLEQIPQELEQLHQNLLDLDASLKQEQIQSRIADLQNPLRDHIHDLELQFNESMPQTLSQSVLETLSIVADQITNCEARLYNLEGHPQVAKDLIKVDVLQAQIQQIETHIHLIRSNCLSELSHYNDFHVKLSILKFKIEELATQIAIELAQVPNLIENKIQKLESPSS